MVIYLESSGYLIKSFTRRVIKCRAQYQKLINILKWQKVKDTVTLPIYTDNSNRYEQENKLAYLVIYFTFLGCKFFILFSRFRVELGLIQNVYMEPHKIDTVVQQKLLQVPGTV
jgi:hypothetical protein